MERLGDIIPQLPARIAKPNASARTSTPSQRSSKTKTSGIERCTSREFGKAMIHLSLLKNTVRLTEPTVEKWFMVMKIFPTKIINMAIVELSLTDRPFPALSDLYQICRRKLPPEMQVDYCPNGTMDPKRLSTKEIEAAAQRLGLDV